MKLNKLFTFTLAALAMAACSMMMNRGLIMVVKKVN